MLKHRIIPTLLSRNGALVKGRGFKSDRVVGHVLQAARVHQARGVDELLIFDVAATKEGRGPDFRLIEQVTAECFMPITVGGGITSVEQVRRLMGVGADKVVLGTAAFRSPWLVEEVARKFGSQAVSVSLDVRETVKALYEATCWWAHLGDLIRPALLFTQEMQSRGAGEIIVQRIERDGTMQGYDLELTGLVAKSVTIPVVASGGCSGVDDMDRAIRAGASAVAAGAIFQFSELTPRQAAIELQAMGIPTRVE